MTKRRAGAPAGKGQDLVLRPRRQVTLPGWMCDALGVEVGDRLTATVGEGGIVLRGSKQVALDALREIQAVFAASGISEDELQQEGRRVREELASERVSQRSGHAAA
jgi:bifunctional DNA-binding transcriptional regulator/antitoxin component of YhaV-PrlF toxin-antitoxin module